MVNLRAHKTELTIAIVTFFFLLFVTTNADTRLGTTYLQFLFGGILLLMINLLIFDRGVQVTVNKNNKTNIGEFMVGVGAWVALLVFSFVILNFVDPSKATFGAIMGSLNAANPIFSESIIINFLVIALAIPFTETFLWARGLEFVADRFGVRINNTTKNRIQFVVIVIVLAALFTLFHATAKQLVGTTLLIVFIMMSITLWLIAQRDGDMRAAIWMHVLANGVAAGLLLTQGGTLSF